MTVSIGRSDGIQLCLACPHPDCIGEKNCEPLLELIKNEARLVSKDTQIAMRHEESDQVLKNILAELQRQEKGYLLTTEIMSTVKVKRNLIFSLIRQGKIMTIKSDENIETKLNVKGRRNRLMVVGVEFFNG